MALLDLATQTQRALPGAGANGERAYSDLVGGLQAGAAWSLLFATVLITGTTLYCCGKLLAKFMSVLLLTSGWFGVLSTSVAASSLPAGAAGCGLLLRLLLWATYTLLVAARFMGNQEGGLQPGTTAGDLLLWLLLWATTITALHWCSTLRDRIQHLWIIASSVRLAVFWIKQAIEKVGSCIIMPQKMVRPTSAYLRVSAKAAWWFLGGVLLVAMMTTRVVGLNTPAVEIPDSVDWRDAVTPTKDEGECGACWAFATVAAVEAAHSIHSGWKLSLSEQQLLDCERSDNGCHGGHVQLALQWIVDNGGITGEADYPFTGARGACDSTKLRHYGATISGYGVVESCNEQALMLAVSTQPVIVYIDSKAPGFREYKGGVFEGPCGTDLDHNLLLVGYAPDEKGGYWIAKNSWGRNWGEDGYIFPRKGVQCGLCGLAILAVYPVI